RQLVERRETHAGVPVAQLGNPAIDRIRPHLSPPRPLLRSVSAPAPRFKLNSSGRRAERRHTPLSWSPETRAATTEIFLALRKAGSIASCANQPSPTTP